MKVNGNTLTIGTTLWVQHGGVEVEERGGERVLRAEEEDAYVKVLNHFGRVLKLYTFEGGRWVDADTGAAAQPFDESQAGRLPAAETAPAAPARRQATPAQKRAAKRAVPATKPVAKRAAPAKGRARTAPPAKGAAKPSARRGTRAPR
jgi:hypothetical protein